MIEIRNVSKSFDKNKAVDNVSVAIKDNTVFGLIGTNGAGKSTVLRMLAGILEPDEGEIAVDGLPVYDNVEAKRLIYFIADEPYFFANATAVDMQKYLKSVYPNFSTEDFYAYLDNFGLEKSRKINTFSKGMKMKLSIICAMAHRPKLLIWDEATTGLDPVVRDEVLDLFLEFIQDEDCSIFFSSHITSDIQKIADYVILIHQGKIIFEEQKDNLVYNYGVAKCGKEKFALLSSDDYIIHRTTNMSVECLVRDKEAFKKKYKNIIVDNATLEDIMLFYIKGGISCED